MCKRCFLTRCDMTEATRCEVSVEVSDISKEPSLVRSLGDCIPRIDPSVWIAPNAVVVGDVELGPDVSIWYGCVLRGDVNFIRVGARSNIQDLSMVHVTTDRFPTVIEEDVTVGHRAVVHGCRVGAGALIGIGSLILDGAVVEPGAWVGAGAVVTPGTVIPSGTLALGTPARPVRDLTEDERAGQLKRTQAYVRTAARHAVSGPFRSERNRE